MDLEKLIEQHNKMLDKKVDGDPYLMPRILNRLKQNTRGNKSSFNINFRKSILTFGFFIFIFFIINFTFVGSLEKRKVQIQETIDLVMNPFNADFQLSIRQVSRGIID